MQGDLDHEIVFSVVDPGVARPKCRHDLRDLSGGKLDVHDWTHHLYDFSALHFFSP